MVFHHNFPQVVVWGLTAAGITSVAFLVLSFYAANRALVGDKRYALIYS